MSDLDPIEKKQLEKLFQMEGGYVLDFVNRSFESFFRDTVQRNIFDTKYDHATNSKGNRLRKFWIVESNAVVGKLTEAMIRYARCLGNADESLLQEASKIARRLLTSAPVSELDSIQPINDDRTFEALATSVREAMESNKPESGLDRLHTYVVRYVRSLCLAHNLPVARDIPLHSLFGAYVKYLRTEGLLESVMTDRILKSSISTLEAFNDVRNQQSLAHDNKMLNYEESLLIYNHVCSSVRFIHSLEQRIEEQKTVDEQQQPSVQNVNLVLW